MRHRCGTGQFFSRPLVAERGRVVGQGEGVLRWRALALVTAYLVVLVVACATARGTTPRPPSWWLRQALCIHLHESVDWHRRWVDWRGRSSIYAGGMQFTQSTWARVGGRGEPWQWPASEQLYRAWLVWKQDGGSWREWGTASTCGVR